ncbi:MAG: DUF5683 domain-containing protein [Bacteroidales bacterium]|nr:DUF5683 domain-containing protein [Bacteroidales bacterium]MCL2132948.1 DUF5683 domain-containing protein [Bacteroidales bacterium]
MKKYCLLILLLFVGFCAQAQERVSVTITGKRPLGKNYWHGLTGRDSLGVTRVWFGSLFAPGYAQAYNRDYWKLPILYGGMGGLIYAGYRYNMSYLDTGNDVYGRNRNFCYIGAALLYWGSMLDGMASYRTPKRYQPERATIYSMLLPGLGQFNNEHYWKIPVVYLGFAFGIYLVDYNNAQYQRFREAYNIKTAEPVEFIQNPYQLGGHQQQHAPKAENELTKRYSAEQLKYYRDSFRTNRDYSWLYLGLFYALNMIDANVFSHLKDFDISDNLSMQLRPTVMYDQTLAMNAQFPAFGMTLNLNFK